MLNAFPLPDLKTSSTFQPFEASSLLMQSLCAIHRNRPEDVECICEQAVNPGLPFAQRTVVPWFSHGGVIRTQVESAMSGVISLVGTSTYIWHPLLHGATFAAGQYGLSFRVHWTDINMRNPILNRIVGYRAGHAKRNTGYVLEGFAALAAHACAKSWRRGDIYVEPAFRLRRRRPC